MLIIYGLGNNEDRFFNTKHNIGRKILELFATKDSLTFTKNKSYYYTKPQTSSANQTNQVIYLFSAGYMNSSGLALKEFCRFNTVDSATQILIIQDDSDQIEGKAKLLPQGGSAGHHGINSIYQELLATQIPMENLWRLKVGIRPAQNTSRSETFVLSRLSPVDTKMIELVATKLHESLEMLAHEQWPQLQTKFNSLTIS